MSVKRIATVCLLVFAVFFLTGCVSETIDNRQFTETPFSPFFQHSLGEYEIVRQRSVSRTVTEGAFGFPFVRRVRIQGTEWTLAYTEHTGEERRLIINTLHRPGHARSNIASAVLRHAEAIIEKQSEELLSKHFSNREIRDFSMSIEIERIGRFNFTDLIDVEAGISLVNLTPQELFTFADYDIIMSFRGPTDDILLREQPELRLRFENLLYDAVLHFNDESLVLRFSGQNLALLRYDATTGEFIWNEQLARMGVWRVP